MIWVLKHFATTPVSVPACMATQRKRQFCRYSRVEVAVYMTHKYAAYVPLWSVQGLITLYIHSVHRRPGWPHWTVFVHANDVHISTKTAPSISFDSACPWVAHMLTSSHAGCARCSRLQFDTDKIELLRRGDFINCRLSLSGSGRTASHVPTASVRYLPH